MITKPVNYTETRKTDISKIILKQVFITFMIQTEILLQEQNFTMKIINLQKELLFRNMKKMEI